MQETIYKLLLGVVLIRDEEQVSIRGLLQHITHCGLQKADSWPADLKNTDCQHLCLKNI